MGTVNNQILAGRVGTVKPSTNVVNFSVATNDYVGKGKGDNGSDYGTTWHNCVAFGKLAESVAKVGVGDVVFVQGRTSEEEYQGKMRRSVVVDRFTILVKKDGASKGTSSSSDNTVNTATQVSEDSDLPF